MLAVSQCAVVLVLGAGVGCTGSIDGINSPGIAPITGTGPTAGTSDGGSSIGACSAGAVLVGGTPLQRLTAQQYANSVRDLLGVSDVRASNLAADEKLGTFAANIHAGLSDLGADQYMRSAEAVARASLARATWDVLVPCDHGVLGDEACAGQFIEKFGKRAYRHPLAVDEVTRYKALYTAFASSGYDNGIRVVTEAMLQSPHFLYRLELGPTGTAEAKTTPLTQYELATRLAYFLWSSTPDDALLSAADAAGLSDQNALQTQAARLLADARARDSLASFHDGTMLDNCIVVWGSEVGKGNNHTASPAPFIAAGGGCGAFKTGRFLQYDPKSVIHNRLLVSICHAMGVDDVTTYGLLDTGQGALDGFLA
jgi:hypothetical protein